MTAQLLSPLRLHDLESVQPHGDGSDDGLCCRRAAGVHGYLLYPACQCRTDHQ